MNRTQLITMVRSNARDFTNSIFRESDIILYINEGIDRVKQVIKECKPMVHLTAPTQTPIILPEEYHSLLALFSTSRCFSQDESAYRAVSFMNEFESKLDELKQGIQSGDIELTDANGDVVESVYIPEYVDLSAYWENETVDLLEETVENLE